LWDFIAQWLFLYMHTYTIMCRMSLLSRRAQTRSRACGLVAAAAAASISRCQVVLFLSAASDFLRLISRRFSRRKMDFTVTAGHQ
jgi:hypothetical protein